MKFSPNTSLRSATGFTLVEVAISIGIVAFALVAIIGILPTGMDVKKQNKEDTIINQDGPMFINAIRTGSRNLANVDGNFEYIHVLRNGQIILGLTNGIHTNVTPAEIIGLLGQPKFEAGTTNRYITRAKFLSNSGPLELEGNQTRALAFSYRLTSEVVPYMGSISTNNAFRTNNLYDLKVTMQWPVYPNGNIGRDKKVFRSQVGGRLERVVSTNISGLDLFFFQPTQFEKPQL